MSGIAGIIHFDGRPVEPGEIEVMTAAMRHRGPDGINHWRRCNVALGQCMLRTTPESLEETQPLTNEDESLVLVMDGRVDNWEELRRELLGKGAVLRSRADAELVLRAYEVWGDDCPDRIIGECVFFVWDVRLHRLFGARDAAGTRHFYYHAGSNWFCFASEIKGLLVLDHIEPKLNESRVLDYLQPEFERYDVVGTFYQGIERLPAGHAMSATRRGVEISRYWIPGNLPEMGFASLDECKEAFLEQLQIAVKCRLRALGPVGAMLSGGLDSSSIVGLISKQFRDELSRPLLTFSLIREDSENCKDWEHIQHMLKDGWVEPTIMTSAKVDQLCEMFLDNISQTDEPFASSYGLTYSILYNAARQAKCNIVLDGIAGDLHFYAPAESLDAIVRGGMYRSVPSVMAAYEKHEMKGAMNTLTRTSLALATPDSVKAHYRRLRERVAGARPEVVRLNREIAQHWLEAKHAQRAESGKISKLGSARAAHALNFTGGILSTAHEVYGQIAFAMGVEPRSPFSDRRMIEFSIQMPLEAKLSSHWYKNLLRKSMTNLLPDAVCWRRDVGNHPGWKFYERLVSRTLANTSDACNAERLHPDILRRIDLPNFEREAERYSASSDYDSGYWLFSLAVLQKWLSTRPLMVE